MKRNKALGAAPLPVEVGIRVTAGLGCLERYMKVATFRRLLGARGRIAAFTRLGAKISAGVVISHGVVIRSPANVTIGAGSRLDGHMRIEAWDRVRIGRCCMFNDDVLLLTAQHDIDSTDFSAILRPIEIGDYAWLPQRIVVLPGVSIGEGAIVGTGSVVTRDVPPLRGCRRQPGAPDWRTPADAVHVRSGALVNSCDRALGNVWRRGVSRSRSPRRASTLVACALLT